MLRKFLLGILLLLACRSVSGQSSGYPESNVSPSYGADTGVVNVMTVPVFLNGSCPLSLTRGFHIFVTPNHNNTTTTPTLNVCSLGAKTVIKQNGGAVAVSDMVTTNDASLEYDGTNFELQNPQTSSAGSSAWSALTNPVGNLLLSMGSNLTEFDYTTALANAWKIANITAATSSVGQSSPVLNLLCGQGWETGTPANTQDCFSVQQVVPNGANPIVLTTFTNNTSSTNGNSGFQFLGLNGAPIIYIGSGSGGGVAIGSPGARVGNFNAGGVELGSGNRGLFFTNAANIDSGSIDSNLSRIGASILGVGNGNAQDTSGVLQAASIKTGCTNTTPVTVSANVSTDQLLMACTLPSAVLNSANRSISIWLAGVYTTVAANTSTIKITVKLCTVSGCGSGTVTPLMAITSSANTGGQTNDGFNLSGWSSTVTAGASSTYEAHGNLSIDLTGVASADSIFTDTNTAVSSPTIDDTGALFIQITGAFSSASASNSFTQRQLIVKVAD